MRKRTQRPPDANQLAASIVSRATGSPLPEPVANDAPLPTPPKSSTRPN